MFCFAGKLQDRNFFNRKLFIIQKPEFPDNSDIDF